MIVTQAVTMIAGLIVSAQCICALNHMTLQTRHSVRVAYLGLLLSTFAAALSPLYESQPTIGDAAILAAVAGYVFVNRRRTYMVGPS